MKNCQEKEKARKRTTQQRGYVSEAIGTGKGICYQIRYRIPSGGGTWIHKSERLYVKGSLAPHRTRP